MLESFTNVSRSMPPSRRLPVHCLHYGMEFSETSSRRWYTQASTFLHFPSYTHLQKERQFCCTAIAYNCFGFEALCRRAPAATLIETQIWSMRRQNAPLLMCYHSRPQRPRSFWSAPKITTSGPVQRHSGFEWLCKHNRLRPEPITFVRLNSEHAQSDGKSVNPGLPVLDLAQRSWFLVLTKRSAASGDENDVL